MASINSNLNTLPPRFFTYRVQGQIYIKTGSLVPLQGHKPQCNQLYIIEDEAAFNERLSDSRNNICKSNIMRSLQTMLNELNPFVKVYKKVAAILAEEELKAASENRPKYSVSMQFYKHKSLDLRRYNTPSNEVAAIFVRENGEPPLNIDFSVQEYSQHLTTLKSTSPNIDPLTFPLLFPNGELGWHENLQHREERNCSKPSYIVTILSVPIDLLFVKILAHYFTLKNFFMNIVSWPMLGLNLKDYCSNTAQS